MYQWYRNDHLLPNEKANRLVINNALLKHLGVYKCEVRNGEGATTWSNPVVLDFVPVEPTVVTEPSDRSVTEGDSCTLQTKGALTCIRRCMFALWDPDVHGSHDSSGCVRYF